MDVSEFCLGSFGVSGNCCREGCPDSIANAIIMSYPCLGMRTNGPNRLWVTRLVVFCQNA